MPWPKIAPTRGRSDPRLAPTEHPNSLDIAWAAGIFEGEGSCCLQRYGFFIALFQKERWLLDRLRALFGGSVNDGYQGAGSFNAGEPIAHWQLSGARARGFVMTIYKFLSPHRKERIREALAPRSKMVW
jgi:hypothetical protein